MTPYLDTLPSLARTELTLPFPPSVNSLYDGGHKSPRRFKSDRYKKWLVEAGWELAAQKQAVRPHPGTVAVTYTLARPDKRPRDLENLSKALGDLLTAHGVIKDDSLIERLTMQWGTGFQGVRVSIEDYGG